MKVQKNVKNFSWSGICWTTKVQVENLNVVVGILAAESDQATVEILAPLAVRFADFWKINRVAIVNAIRKFLSKRFKKDDELPSQCTLETVSVEGAGWRVGIAGNSKKYFRLNIEFVIDGSSILGEGANIQIMGILNDDLTTDSKKLDMEFVVL